MAVKLMETRDTFVQDTSSSISDTSNERFGFSRDENAIYMHLVRSENDSMPVRKNKNQSSAARKSSVQDTKQGIRGSLQSQRTDDDENTEHFFVPAFDASKAKLLPSPIERKIQSDKETVLEMKLERAEFEIFRLKGQLDSAMKNYQIKATRADTLEKHLATSRSRENRVSDVIENLEKQLKFQMQQRDWAAKELEMLAKELSQEKETVHKQMFLLQSSFKQRRQARAIFKAFRNFQQSIEHRRAWSDMEAMLQERMKHLRISWRFQGWCDRTVLSKRTYSHARKHNLRLADGAFYTWVSTLDQRVAAAAAAATCIQHAAAAAAAPPASPYPCSPAGRSSSALTTGADDSADAAAAPAAAGGGAAEAPAAAEEAPSALAESLGLVWCGGRLRFQANRLGPSACLLSAEGGGLSSGLLFSATASKQLQRLGKPTAPGAAGGGGGGSLGTPYPVMVRAPEPAVLALNEGPPGHNDPDLAFPRLLSPYRRPRPRGPAPSTTGAAATTTTTAATTTTTTVALAAAPSTYTACASTAPLASGVAAIGHRAGLRRGLKSGLASGAKHLLQSVGFHPARPARRPPAGKVTAAKAPPAASGQNLRDYAADSDLAYTSSAAATATATASATAAAKRPPLSELRLADGNVMPAGGAAECMGDCGSKGKGGGVGVVARGGGGMKGWSGFAWQPR